MQMIGHFLAKRNLYFIFSAPLSKKRSRASGWVARLVLVKGFAPYCPSPYFWAWNFQPLNTRFAVSFLVAKTSKIIISSFLIK